MQIPLYKINSTTNRPTRNRHDGNNDQHLSLPASINHCNKSTKSPFKFPFNKNT